MSYAEQIADRFRRLRESGNVDAQLAAIEEFYLRNNFFPRMRPQIEFGPWGNLRVKFEDGETLDFDYDRQRQRFTRHGLLASVTELAEELQVPVAYIQGVVDAASALHDRVIQSAELQRANEKTERKLAVRAEKVKARVVYSKMFRAASAEADRAAHQKYAEQLNELQRQVQQKSFGTSFSLPDCLKRQKDVRFLPIATRRCGSGIYFLCKDDEVVYVGQAIEVAHRVAQHLGHKAFTHVWFLACPERKLNDVERQWITALLPKYNREPFAMRLKEKRKAEVPERSPSVHESVVDPSCNPKDDVDVSHG